MADLVSISLLGVCTGCFNPCYSGLWRIAMQALSGWIEYFVLILVIVDYSGSFAGNRNLRPNNSVLILVLVDYSGSPIDYQI